MNQDYSASVLELGERKVSRSSSVASLFAEDAKAHVRFLDHAHVIGSISDRCCHWLGSRVLDKFNHFSFLSRSHATTKHGIAFEANIAEVLLQRFSGAEQVTQSATVDNQGERLVFVSSDPFEAKER